jgi:hypothetical protein
MKKKKRTGEGECNCSGRFFILLVGVKKMSLGHETNRYRTQYAQKKKENDIIHRF